MRAILFLIGSVAGFLALSKRYRRAPLGNTGILQTIQQGTPVVIGDGSFWVSSPGIDDSSSWTRGLSQLRSPVADGALVGAELLVNGSPVACPDASGDVVITVVYNGNSTLTVATPETHDGHLDLVWSDPSGAGFGRGAAGWTSAANRWTFESPAYPGGRITRILVDGTVWYRAKDYDTPGTKAKCELRLTYFFGGLGGRP